MDEKSKLQPMVELKVQEKGPLIVQGPVKLVTPDGNVVVRDTCAICRCGNSKNQPYCDGSHLRTDKHNYEHEEFF